MVINITCPGSGLSSSWIQIHPHLLVIYVRSLIYKTDLLIILSSNTVVGIIKGDNYISFISHLYLIYQIQIIISEFKFLEY